MWNDGASDDRIVVLMRFRGVNREQEAFDSDSGGGIVMNTAEVDPSGVDEKVFRDNERKRLRVHYLR